jgi:hypothetical protein
MQTHLRMARLRGEHATGLHQEMAHTSPASLIAETALLETRVHVQRPAIALCVLQDCSATG